MLSDEQVKTIMFDLEKSNDILSYQVDGVSLYYLLRFSIEIDLRVEHISRQHSQKENTSLSLFKRIKNLIRKLYERKRTGPDISLFDAPDDILESPFLFVSPSIYINEAGIGPHLIDIVEYYYTQGYSINFIQRTDYSTSVFPKRSKFYHRFLAYDLRQKDNLSRQTYRDLRNFLVLLSEKTKIDFISKLDIYYSHVVRIIGESNQLCDYIHRSKAQYVFTYSVYTEPGILLACRKAKIKLVEVQHGVVLKNSIYYQSALGKIALDKSYLLMPDCILTLGSEWRNILVSQRSFFNEKNVYVVGTSKFNKWKSQLDSPVTSTRPIRLVFFSQGRSYNNIFDISDFIESFLLQYHFQINELNLEIILRPHPNDQEEFAGLVSKYSDSVSLETLNEKNSLESIAAADFVFAASSMCLYEAIALGKIAISMDKFSGIINKEHIHLVKSIDGLFDLIDQYRRKQLTVSAIPYLEEFNPGVLDEFYSIITP